MDARNISHYVRRLRVLYSYQLVLTRVQVTELNSNDAFGDQKRMTKYTTKL